jgi:hypothetical protein
MAVELVERVRSDADGEEEGGERDEETPRFEVGGETGADRDLREMPERVRRMMDPLVIAPAAWGERVEGRPRLRVQARRPHMT